MNYKSIKDNLIIISYIVFLVVTVTLSFLHFSWIYNFQKYIFYIVYLTFSGRAMYSLTKSQTNIIKYGAVLVLGIILIGSSLKPLFAVTLLLLILAIYWGNYNAAFRGVSLILGAFAILFLCINYYYRFSDPLNPIPKTLNTVPSPNGIYQVSILHIHDFDYQTSVELDRTYFGLYKKNIRCIFMDWETNPSVRWLDNQTVLINNHKINVFHGSIIWEDTPW